MSDLTTLGDEELFDLMNNSEERSGDAQDELIRRGYDSLRPIEEAVEALGERRPDTVVVTFPTYVDVVVDLKTGETKEEYEGQYDKTRPVCSTVWAEGELLTEKNFGDDSGYYAPGDQAAVDNALKIIRGE